MTKTHSEIMKGWEEREQVRHEYEQSRIKSGTAKLESGKNYMRDSEDHRKARHMTRCPSFQECAFDYKCKNYDSKYMACVNCVLHETNNICHKKDLHTEANMAKLIKRPRLDLDAKKKEVTTV